MTKRLLWAAILLAVTIALYYLSRPRPSTGGQIPAVVPNVERSGTSPAEALAENTSVNVPPATATQTESSGTVESKAPATADQASTPSVPMLTVPPPQAKVEEVTGPADELDNVQFMVRGYRDALGENPVGNNAEITRALMGDNARQVKMTLPVGSHLNNAGELSDRWGTPYFFHQLSGQEMEIRSAGPDQQMWTPDDLLSR